MMRLMKDELVIFVPLFSRGFMKDIGDDHPEFENILDLS